MSPEGGCGFVAFFVAGDLKGRALEDGVHRPGSPTVLHVKRPREGGASVVHYWCISFPSRQKFKIQNGLAKGGEASENNVLHEKFMDSVNLDRNHNLHDADDDSGR